MKRMIQDCPSNRIPIHWDFLRRSTRKWLTAKRELARNPYNLDAAAAVAFWKAARDEDMMQLSFWRGFARRSACLGRIYCR